MSERRNPSNRLVPTLAFALIAMGLVIGGLALWLGMGGGGTNVEQAINDEVPPTAAPAVASKPTIATLPDNAQPATSSDPVATPGLPVSLEEPPLGTAPVQQPRTFVFPVKSSETHYDSSHHDYPAADMFAPCGTQVVAVTDGTIEEIEAVDTYDSSNPDGGTKSGLMAALVDSRGVRYYGSHMSAVSVKAGDVVSAGQPIGAVGDTGNAAGTGCHLHFGLSPACLQGWEHRRGHVGPQPFLDAWRSDNAVDPLEAIKAIPCEVVAPS